LRGRNAAHVDNSGGQENQIAASAAAKDLP
jgi:hypothetical protein